VRKKKKIDKKEKKQKHGGLPTSRGVDGADQRKGEQHFSEQIKPPLREEAEKKGVEGGTEQR